MKKILLTLFVTLFILTGCGKTVEEKRESKYGNQNNEISNSLANLQIGKDGLESFKDLMILDDNTLGTELGLTLNDVENYIAAVPTALDSRLYIIIKPKSGSEEKVKKAISIYFDNIEQRLGDGTSLGDNATEEEKKLQEEKIKMVQNHLEKQVNGYYVYIISSDNDAVFKVVENNLKK